MARGKKVQRKNKKNNSTKNNDTKSRNGRVAISQTNIESKSEDDSQLSTNDSSEPEKVVKKLVGRRKKDRSSKVSSSTKKKSVGRPKKRKHRSESSDSKNSNEESSDDRSKEDHSKESSQEKENNQLDSDGGESSSEKSTEDKDNYEVEDIIDFKIEDDIKYFLIRWKGYDSSVDSWEKRRSLNCPELIARFYEKHPEARTSNTKKKRNYDSDYEVSSSDSNCDLLTIRKTSKRNGKNATTQYCTSDEESESESELDTDSEPEVIVKKSVGRPRNHAMVKVSSSSEKRIVGRPRKHENSEDEDQYEVEDIIDFRIEDNTKYFLVRWKGFDSSVDSWERHRSLNCPELIAEFYKKHPEASVAVYKANYKKTKTHHTVDSDYGPTYYEQLTMRPIGSDKKRGKKSICARKSDRKTSVKSTYKTIVHSTSDEESESESEVGIEDLEPVEDKKKSVGRPKKLANVSSSTKKKSAGRPRKQGDRNEVPEDPLENGTKVDNKDGSSEEEQGEDDRSDCGTIESNQNSILP